MMKHVLRLFLVGGSKPSISAVMNPKLDVVPQKTSFSGPGIVQKKPAKARENLNPGINRPFLYLGFDQV